MADAWMVLFRRSERAVFLERARADQAVVEHHGVLRPLVYVEDMNRLLTEAYQQGWRDGQNLQKGKTDEPTA